MRIYHRSTQLISCLSLSFCRSPLFDNDHIYCPPICDVHCFVGYILVETHSSFLFRSSGRLCLVVFLFRPCNNHRVSILINNIVDIIKRHQHRQTVQLTPFTNQRANHNHTPRHYLYQTPISTPLPTSNQSSAYFLDRIDLDNYSIETLRQIVENLLSTTNSKGQFIVN